jgi:hypothetical protein
MKFWQLAHSFDAYGNGPCLNCGTTREEILDNVKSSICPGAAKVKVEADPPYFRAMLGDAINVELLDSGAMVLSSKGVEIRLDVSQRRRLQKISEQF